MALSLHFTISMVLGREELTYSRGAADSVFALHSLSTDCVRCNDPIGTEKLRPSFIVITTFREIAIRNVDCFQHPVANGMQIDEKSDLVLPYVKQHRSLRVYVGDYSIAIKARSVSVYFSFHVPSLWIL